MNLESTMTSLRHKRCQTLWIQDKKNCKIKVIDLTIEKCLE